MLDGLWSLVACYLGVLSLVLLPLHPRRVEIHTGSFHFLASCCLYFNFWFGARTKSWINREMTSELQWRSKGELRFHSLVAI